MPKTYRAIHQWNHWLTSFLGKSLLDAEKLALQQLHTGLYGKHAVLLGVSHQHTLLESSISPCQYVLGPLVNHDKSVHYIEGKFAELPLQSGSVDQVIVPHTLEFVDNPYQLICEACRIVKPEGRIFIMGFNLYSLWGLKKIILKSEGAPWSANFISIATIRKWLMLADFELEKQHMLCYRPPTQQPKLYQRLKWLEWLGSKLCKPFGGVYILQAKAKVVPLTPIRLHWKQEISGVGFAPNTFLKPTARNSS